MTPQIFFSQHFEVVSKNDEFDADFKSVDKSVKKVPTKKVGSVKV
jgi:hypothetical protein